MLKIVFIEDIRRPERNDAFKKVMQNLNFCGSVEFCDTTEVKVVASLEADGVICHAGMDGYNVIKHFAKKYEWPMLAYTGGYGAPPKLRSMDSRGFMFSVDSKYFEEALAEFISYCERHKSDD